MKTKRSTSFLTVVVVVACVNLVSAGTYSGGTGLGKLPYLIGTVDDWQELINTPTDWTKGFMLIADIDFQGQTITPVAPDTRTDYGFQGTKFTGTFNGQWFVLKNAVINRPTRDFVGVFGFVGAGAEIINLRIKNITVTGQQSTGLLAGENEGAITRCQALGAVAGNGDYTGGLVGYNNGTIILCCAQGSVTGVAGWHRGGLVGYNTATISNCYSAGTVSGTGNVLGGLVGTLGAGSITQCYSSSRIDSSASYTGGLIAYMESGTVSGSYWDTVLSGRAASAGGAGVTGKTTAQMKQQATFAGWDFSGGTASWQITENQSCPRIVSLLPAYSGGIGTSGTPYLIATTSDWLEMIYTASDYSNHFRMTADIDFKGQMIAPVAANTLSFDQAKFTGTFDGNGFSVSNAVINRPLEDMTGLFGVVSSSGVISGLAVENISVTGRQYVGGIAAYNQGQILQCSVTGVVAGNYFYVGGLAGWQENLVHQCFANVEVSTSDGYYTGGLVGGNSNGTITQSCAIGNVTSDSQYAGGLVGYNGGVTSSIENCYATGDVSSSHISGGLVGSNVCSISRCYSTGFVSGTARYDGGLVGMENSPGTTVFSYWDTRTSGKTTSAGGIGKTTAELKVRLSYPLWDFVNTWKMLEDNYPQLKWSVAMLTPDLNNTGVVGLDDLLLFVQHWLEDGCLYPDWCGGADLNAGGTVNLVDFALFAESFDPYVPPAITWVSINDSGAGMKDEHGNPISQGGFTGDMSKYETTNAQFAHYLNAALASGDIIVHTNNVVYAAGDTSYSQPYFSTAAASSYSQITYSGGTFSVRTRDGHSMADHPVVMVSWYGATAFADYYGWRLPTRWEWQAVADYDGSYTYGCGTTLNQTMANYDYTNPLGLTNTPYTSPVGHYPAYGYGLCDMAGNVYEWTSSAIGSNRIIHGGSWYHDDIYCLVSLWYGNNPSIMTSFFGFRVCRGDIQPDITWVYINDPGVPQHGGFTGDMSKYETTNAQFAHYLNAALTSGDITVSDDYVRGANGSNSGTDFVSEIYYHLAGPGYTTNGATHGGAARIHWTGSSFTVDSGFENHPVTYVSWYGATAFASFYGWRLPTEWEWQAAADYDGTYTYGCGTTINNNIANYLDSIHPHGTTPVGHFGTYGYGMADMSGNVWEWTSSMNGSTSYRFRGGGWGWEDNYCIVVHQLGSGNSGFTGRDIGFRVCR